VPGAERVIEFRPPRRPAVIVTFDSRGFARFIQTISEKEKMETVSVSFPRRPSSDGLGDHRTWRCVSQLARRHMAISDCGLRISSAVMFEIRIPKSEIRNSHTARLLVRQCTGCSL
jgi:hypothetical protein